MKVRCDTAGVYSNNESKEMCFRHCRTLPTATRHTDTRGIVTAPRGAPRTRRG